MTPELRRVIALANRRGACVRVVDGKAWDRAKDEGLHESPFSHMDLAIDARNRVVYLRASHVNDKEAAGSVVHELAHLHAPTKPENIQNANEYGWLAWEIAVGREARVRRAWDLVMKDYCVGSGPAGLVHLDGADWGDLTRSEKHAIIADRMKAARRRGIVDARGRAVWRRLPTDGG